MRIGGFQRSSLIDYPDRISSIVFTQGCNFRCPYCHNPELVVPELFTDPIPKEKVLSFLEKRKGLIDGVVIGGGEPLLQSDLKDFLISIKRMGYLVKLDTNGSNPERLKELISRNLPDYIAVDYKSPIEKYSSIIRAEVNTDDIRKTLMTITKSGLPYEVRTTLFHELTTDDVLEMMKELNVCGVENYYLQMGVPGRQKDLNLCREPLKVNINLLFRKLSRDFTKYGIRNLSFSSKSLFAT